MTDITVEVPSVLSSALGGQRSLQVPLPADGTVGGILDALGEQYPLFARRVRDERGQVRRFVNVFIGPDNIRTLQGLGSAVREGQSVLIMQSVAGG
ncbi:MoaD/ThiS family protein [Paeniglutamicibacter sp.]|uniref:MoaD/ThiS family protein n=1 Tax=Paeniglutamicibacter sp. TaxID=1934391 RepID=UPI0039899241